MATSFCPIIFKHPSPNFTGTSRICPYSVYSACTFCAYCFMHFMDVVKTY